MSRRRPPPRSAVAVLGVVLAAVVFALLAIWWATQEPAEPAGRHGPSRAPAEGATAREAPRAPLPVPPAKGEIGAFDVRVARELGRDRLSAAPMAGPARVAVTDVDWRDAAGRPFFRARRVTGGLDLQAALQRNAIASEVVAESPEVYLSRAAGDTVWNYERVLAELLAPSEDARAAIATGTAPPERVVAVNGLTIRNGYGSVRLPEREVRLLDVDAQLPEVRLSAPGLPEPVVRVADGKATLVLPASDVRQPFRVADATFRFPERGTTFEAGALAFGSSRIVDVQGLYDPRAPGLGLTMSGRAAPIRLADLRPFAPKLEAEGGGTLRFALEPTRAGAVRLTLTDVALESEGSRVSGDLVATVLGEARPALESAELRLEPLRLALVERLTGRTLPYVGTVSGRVTGRGGDIHFDLTGQLTSAAVPQPFRVGLTGEALFGDAGVVLRRATAELTDVPLAALRAVAPSLPLAGAISGEVTLTGPPNRAPLTLDVRLGVAGGVAVVGGTVDLTGPVAAYDLSGRLIGVSPARLVSFDAPPVSLTAGFALRGRGFEPATAAATFRLAGRFTGWKTDADDVVRLRGGVAAGVLTLDTATAGVATAQLTASGRWSFSAPGAGAIRYAASISDLGPFAAYIPAGTGVEARGSAALAGTLAGTLQRPDLRGDFAVTGIEAGEWAVSGAGGSYALVLGDSVPDVWVHARATGVQTPTTVDFRALEATARLAAPRLELTLDGVRENGGLVQLAATGELPASGPRSVLLTRLVADLADGRWQLQAPAVVEWVPGGAVTVRNLDVRNSRGPGLLSLDGTLAPADATDYRLRAEALPMGELLELARVPTEVSGLLYADAEVHGPAAAPRVRGAFRVENGKIQSFDLSALRGELAFEAGRVTANAEATLAQGGGLRLDAALPASLTLGLPPGFRVLGSGPAQGSLVADSVPLAILEPFAPQVQDLEGRLDARMTLAGTADQPVLAGAATLSGGAFRLPATAQEYRDISGRLTLRDRRIVVDSVRARSDGWLLAMGSVELRELNNPVADLRVDFERFRPMNAKDRQDAALWGTLAVRGPLRSPTVTGDLRLDDGTIVLPTSAGVDILNTELAEAAPAPVLGREVEAVPAAPIGADVRVANLHVTSGNDMWYATEEARVQLSGDVTVNKAPDEPVRVVGTLTGERGTFTLTAGPLLVRRFDIVRADIRFYGSEELNPGLDIVASETVFDPQQGPIDIQVHVTGTLETPRLALSTAQGVQWPETELLAYLVFGTRNPAAASQLPPSQRAALLQQTLFGGIAEFASMQLESQLLAAGLPVDIFEIRPGFQGTALAPTVVVGRQLTNDVFLTLEYAVGVLFGGTQGPAAGSHGATVSLVWRTSPQWTTTFSYGPVTRGPAFGAFLPTPSLKSQFSVELRRRWTY